MEKTPHEIGLIVAHQVISYGSEIEKLQDGMVLKLLKKTIFEAVRDTLKEHTTEISETEPST